MKAKKQPIELKPGQLWRLADSHIEIMEVGKSLAHYRRFKNQKRVPTSLDSIKTVQDYLAKNKATLVKNN